MIYSGCTITGIPSIGKTFFALFLFFYIWNKYPGNTIIWRADKVTCYQFLPDGEVKRGIVTNFMMHYAITVTFTLLMHKFWKNKRLICSILHHQRKNDLMKLLNHQDSPCTLCQFGIKKKYLHFGLKHSRIRGIVIVKNSYFT